jgi:hypothetical protein
LDQRTIAIELLNERNEREEAKEKEWQERTKFSSGCTPCLQPVGIPCALQSINYLF